MGEFLLVTLPGVDGDAFFFFLETAILRWDAICDPVYIHITEFRYHHRHTIQTITTRTILLDYISIVYPVGFIIAFDPVGESSVIDATADGFNFSEGIFSREYS